jgi:hypothetical protein
MRFAAFAPLLLVYAAACTIYFGDDDVADDDVIVDDDTCDPEPLLLVDPGNLQCQDFGFGGCGAARAAIPPIPSWGLCESSCTALGEGDCLGAPGCRAAYDYNCYTNGIPCTLEVAYLGCFAVDMQGPVQGECADLDAWTCSMHDDCVALHDTNADSEFKSCVNENRGAPNF